MPKEQEQEQIFHPKKASLLGDKISAHRFNASRHLLREVSKCDFTTNPFRDSRCNLRTLDVYFTYVGKCVSRLKMILYFRKNKEPGVNSHNPSEVIGWKET